MSSTTPKAVKEVRQKSRRRKKRRTEDFSSDSSSSDSSSSSDELEIEVEEKKHEGPDVELSTSVKKQSEKLSPSTRKALKAVEWKSTNQPKRSTNHSTVEIETTKEDITAERAELDKKYLQLMTAQFSNDLDELRKRPDFNEHSLMLLAKTLQSSSNLFDTEELRELLKQ